MTLKSAAARYMPDILFTRSLAFSFKRFEADLPVIVGALPPGGVALDVGAWYGPWSYWLAKRASTVHAFEPNPEVARVLRKTVAANVVVHQMAASDVDGSASLALPEGGKGTEGRASLEGLSESTAAVNVKTARLDDLDLHDVTFMKIDVEGHERAAIAGAQDLITASHPLLVVELEERHGGIAPAVDLLAEWGYSGRVRVDDRWRELDEFDLAAHQAEHLERYGAASFLKSAARGSKYVNNVVFTHPETTWDVP
ncbi:MAG TPA: FkbM family methyltransferase [Acidimicrobiia bacterium]